MTGGPLGARIRTLFLLFGIFNLVSVLPRVLLEHAQPLLPRVAAGVAAVALAVWWLQRYRARGFPAWSILLDGAAMAVIAYGMHDWVRTLGMTFGFVAFRGLYGSWRQVLAYTVVVFAAALGGVAATEPAELVPMLQQAPGVPTLALLTSVVAEATRQQERAAARERVFARLGASLASAADAAVISRHTAEAATELLAGLPGAWAAMVLAAPTGEDTVAAVVGAAPQAVFDGGPGGEPYALHSPKRRHGTLLVGADRPLPAEVRPALETLAAQASLGLTNAERAADLHHLAYHDNLTGLANRSLLREHLAHAMARARRGSPVAVLLLDLDGFKRVNDTYGHAAGDQLLVAVAHRLREGIRGADTAGRLGGDEFAVVLDGMDAHGDAVLVARRLLQSIRTPVTVSGVELTPSCTIGVACWRNHAEIDQLLHDADAAMYAAKVAGRGRVGVFGEGPPKVLTPVTV